MAPIHAYGVGGAHRIGAATPAPRLHRLGDDDGEAWLPDSGWGHPLLAIAFEAVKGFKSDDSEELGQGKLHKVRCGMACNRDQHDEHKELCGLMSSVF